MTEETTAPAPAAPLWRHPDEGRRADAVFGPFAGKAALVENAGVTTATFAADYPALRRVQSGTVDGAPFAVLAVAKHPLVKGMVVLTVTEKGDE